ENVSKVHNSTNYVTNEYKNYYERFLMFPDREQSICSKKAKLEQIQEGMSMMPFLYGGDYVYYDPISFKDVKMGDVIIYEQEGERIIHTVVAVYETYLMTAGYNNLGMDYRVMPDEVKARWCFKK
ncbi:hypothetical protein, partial [Lutibacter sp.]|uniref:hypothetical protein n=1 Tax=Lutibacter sp. TaxID=1925666 RepID=UPI0034A088E8